MLLTALTLAAQIGMIQPLAPGQRSLYAAHIEGFPKAAWVVDEHVPASSSPQLEGPLMGLLHKGTFEEVAGLGTPVLHVGVRGGMDSVLAVSMGQGVPPRAGYVVARHLAVVETFLGHCSPAVAVFASVTGGRLLPGVKGFVLDVSVWERRGEGVPTLVLSGPNTAPGLRFVQGAGGGAAVGLDGLVVVLDVDGNEVWRSPAGRRFVLEGPSSHGFRVSGPGGEATVPPS